MKKIRPRFLVLLISVIMVISGISVAWLVQTSFGTVITTEIDLRTADNVLIHSTLQVPTAASDSNPMPGVVVIHGSMQSKEWISAFGIELSRRGFAVLTIDAAGYGNSDYAERDSDRGGIAALEYLKSRGYVSTVGMLGHSMGAGICMYAINQSSIQVDALVLVGGGSGGTWANSTYPRNMLVTVGQYDELHNVAGLSTALMVAFGTSSPVVTGQIYGDFTSGTARKLVIGFSNHLTEVVDPVIISETTDWLKESLKGGENEYWLPKGDLIYPLHIFGGLVSSIGILLSIFPLVAILLDYKPFTSLKKVPSSSYKANRVTLLVVGLLYGVIGLGLFIPAMFISRMITFFPQYTGDLVAIWLLACSITGGIIIAVFYYLQRKRGSSLELTDFGIELSGSKQLITALGKSALLAVLVIFWLYGWTLVVDLFLALDFRAFLPLFNDLTFTRLKIAPIYLIFTIPFFYVEGSLIMGLLRTAPKETWFRTQFYWTVKGAFIKCLIYVFIILLQFTMSYIIGAAFISGMTGYYLIFLWMFTPMFAITTAIFAWSYRLTDRIHIGIFLNSFIFSWILAELLSLAF